MEAVSVRRRDRSGSGSLPGSFKELRGKDLRLGSLAKCYGEFYRIVSGSLEDAVGFGWVVQEGLRPVLGEGVVSVIVRESASRRTGPEPVRSKNTSTSRNSIRARLLSVSSATETGLAPVDQNQAKVSMNALPAGPPQRTGRRRRPSESLSGCGRSFRLRLQAMSGGIQPRIPTKVRTTTHTF